MGQFTLLLLTVLAADDGWPSDAKMRKLLAEEGEKIRPLEIERLEIAVRLTREEVATAKANRMANLRTSSESLKSLTKELADLKSGALSPIPVFFVPQIGKIGRLVTFDGDGPIRILDVVDESTVVISWRVISSSGNVSRIVAKVVRTTTAKLKVNERFLFPPGKLWYVAAEDSWQGERIPVLVPFTK